MSHAEDLNDVAEKTFKFMCDELDKLGLTKGSLIRARICIPSELGAETLRRVGDSCAHVALGHLGDPDIKEKRITGLTRQLLSVLEAKEAYKAWVHAAMHVIDPLLTDEDREILKYEEEEKEKEEEEVKEDAAEALRSVSGN